MKTEKLVPITHFLLRAVSGLLFMLHGGQKIFDWFGGIPAEFGGHPAAWSQTWVGGVLEFYGGLLIMIGLCTRPVAFVLSGMMAVAYFQFHFKSELFWPMQNGGEPAVLFCFIFLFLCAYGSGKWSFDELFRGRKAPIGEG